MDRHAGWGNVGRLMNALSPMTLKNVRRAPHRMQNVNHELPHKVILYDHEITYEKHKHKVIHLRKTYKPLIGLAG